MRLAITAFSALVTTFASPANAQEAVIYGNRQSALAVPSGAFVPTGTDWECAAIDGRRCWDGKVWHELYPPEPRVYARNVPQRVACRAITKSNHDCWDGKN